MSAYAAPAFEFTPNLLPVGGAVVRQEQSLPLHSDEHVVMLRKVVRERALELQFGLVDQTKLITAASEIARNTLKYGGGGEVRLQNLTTGTKVGVCLTFVDDGPGIADMERAMTDGYTSGGGLGLGLGGARRLVDDFEICTQPEKGTAVILIKWKRC